MILAGLGCPPEIVTFDPATKLLCTCTNQSVFMEQGKCLHNFILRVQRDVSERNLKNSLNVNTIF